MRLVSVGRLAGSLLLGLSVTSACGGQSQSVASDDGSAGEEQGGTGSGAGPAGGVGGVSPDGGTGFGGVSTSGGQGGVSGTIAVGGSTGVGGTAPCPECPPADYGLVIEGDGTPYDMTFNGIFDLGQGKAIPPPPPSCPDEPLRGSVGGCGRGIQLSACEDPQSGPPCLEISGQTVRYIDRQTGRVWAGIITSDVPSVSVTGVSSGTLTVQLSSDANAILVLTVKYTFCSQLGVLLIPC